MVVAMIRLAMSESCSRMMAYRGNFYLQKDGIPLTIVPSYVTVWITKTRDRKIGGKIWVRHFEGKFYD